MTNDFKVGDRVFVYIGFTGGAGKDYASVIKIDGDLVTARLDIKRNGSFIITLTHDYFHRFEDEPRFYKSKREDLIAYIEKLEQQNDKS